MERTEYRLMAELESTHWWYRALHADLVDRLRAMGLRPGDRLLDAGCGTGGFLARLTAGGLGVRAFGVERDAEAAATSRSKSPAPIARGDVARLPYRDGAFAAIVSADVLYHRGVDEEAALSEFLRCLAPGGNLLLHLPAHAWLRSSHDDHVHGARRYTVPGVRSLLRSAGFKIERSGYRNSLLYPLMVAHRLTSGRRAQSSHVEPPHPIVSSVLHTVTRVERAAMRCGCRFPTGGSVFAWARRP